MKKNIIYEKSFYTQKQKGAALVEFAIILPLLLILIFGIIEFGLLLYNQGIITHAAREGARLGVVYNVNNRISTSLIENEVNRYIQDNLVSFTTSTPGINIDSECPILSNSGQKLSVRIDYTYSFLILPNLINDFAGGINLQSEAIMVCE